MKRYIYCALYATLCSLAAGAQGSAAYENVYKAFSFGDDPNAGLTAFVSTLVPMGGSAESVGTAYTAIASDISFLEYNPAGSSIQTRTALAAFHNNWIADAKVESLVFTTRFNRVGLAFGAKWLYLPFTEYDDFAGRVKSSYYSEVLGTANVSALLFPRYPFYGLAFGVNVKLGYRIMPDYADNSGAIIKGSGKTQSAFTAMADVGLLTKFNFLKPYSAREKNCAVGISMRNLGFPVKGDPLPTLVSAGISYNVIEALALSCDVNVPLNLLEPKKSEKPYWAAGLSYTIKNHWKLSAGFLFKGRNPRLSLGVNLDFSPLLLAVNYTLDLTTSFTPLNRVSIAASFLLGDRGRAEKARRVEELYLRGLTSYAKGNIDEAVAAWDEALLLDPHYTPVIESRKTALAAQSIQKQIEAMKNLD